MKDNIGCFFSLTHFLSLITYPCFSCRSPDEVTAEDEAQDEDKDACPEDDHVDVEGQVLEGDGRHGARLVGVNQSKTTEAPWTNTRGKIYKDSIANNMFQNRPAPPSAANGSNKLKLHTHVHTDTKKKVEEDDHCTFLSW